MKSKKRSAAAILAALMFVAMMALLFVTAYEAGHDCIGESCPVCAVMAVCQHAFKTLCCAFIAAAIAFICRLIPYAISFPYDISYNKTLTSLKVKLLN